MPPIDTTALTAIFAWVWSQYGKTITDKAGKAVWERLRWEDRALAYAQKVQRLYGKMQILGQAKPVPLEGIYTAVSLLDRPTAMGRYTVEELQADFTGRGRRYFHAGGDEQRRDGLEMVRSDEKQNLFILGKPGAGKTTFLKHIALRGVNGELGKRVPIFVGLKQLADSGKSVFDYIVEQFDICEFPDAETYLERLLKSGKALLLFDGLDEVNVADREREHLITDVENFTRKYDGCQRLITCRLAANEYSFQNYTYVEMADFDEDQIREFVGKWFGGDAQQLERRDLFLFELAKAESEGLRELARVPLLLALLCLGFEETLKLSSRRAELYEEALDALLKKWDAGRNIRRDEIYRDMSLKRKQQMLAQVAAETFDQAEYFIPERTLARSFETFLSRMPDAQEGIEGQTVLQAIVAQHGLFIERARDIYSFAHLTFQEYFTARYVVENEARGSLARLIEHYADPRFREVFLLTAAQLSNATDFFGLFLERLASDAEKNPTVMALLRQLASKAVSTANGLVGEAASRSAYLCLALDRDRANDFDFDISRNNVVDLTRALTRDLDLSLASVLVSDHALDLALNIGYGRRRGLSHDHALSRELESRNWVLLARDIALMKARRLLVFASEWRTEDREAALLSAAAEFLSAAANQAGTLENSGEAERIDNLSRRAYALAAEIDRDDPRSMAAGLAAELDVLLAVANLDFLTLKDEDLDLVSHYVNGNRLLLVCLDLAIVPDRQAIKDQLLLLPPE